MAEFRVMALPEIGERWDSTGWTEEQWLAVLVADEDLFNRILAGMARVSAKHPIVSRQDVVGAAVKALGRRGPSPQLVAPAPTATREQQLAREQRRLALERQAIRAARAARYVAEHLAVEERPAVAPAEAEVEVPARPANVHRTSASPAPVGLRVRRPRKPARVHGNATAAYTLTPRETQMVALCAQGLSLDEVAQVLSLSVDTVKTTTMRARRRYGARNTTHLVAMALERGQISMSA